MTEKKKRLSVTEKTSVRRAPRKKRRTVEEITNNVDPGKPLAQVLKDEFGALDEWTDSQLMELLTPQQVKFTNEYLKILMETPGIKHVDARSRAYQLAYGGNEHSCRTNSTKLINQEALQEYMKRRMVEIVKVGQISPEYVICKIRDVVETSMQEKPVFRNGEPTGEYRMDAANALRGLELLGKTMALFKDKIETTVTHSIEDMMREISKAPDSSPMARLRQQQALAKPEDIVDAEIVEKSNG